MSVFATLALMTTVFAKKIGELEPRPVDVEITALKARVNEMDRQLTDLENRLADSNRDLTLTRIEADRWRELVERRQQPAIENRRERAIQEAHALAQLFQAQAQMQTSQANIHLAQQAQQNLNPSLYQQHQLGMQHPLSGLGQMSQAQALADVEMFCNCVPARHDMFMPQGALSRSR